MQGTMTERVRAVEQALKRGNSFESVEAEINSAPLSDDHKSALWLYAWSHLSRRHQRTEALAHIARLEATHE
jgi:hypothetical protein